MGLKRTKLHTTLHVLWLPPAASTLPPANSTKPKVCCLALAILRVWLKACVPVLCETTLADEGCTPDEIRDEVSAVLAQQAYIMQLLHRDDEALSQYLDILKFV